MVVRLPPVFFSLLSHGMRSVKLCILENFTLYLRNSWSLNLRAIESCICGLRSIERKMRSILRTVHLLTYDLYGPVCNAFNVGNILRGQVGGVWALEISTFLGPVKWHPAVRRVPFGAQGQDSRAQPLSTCPDNGFAASKALRTGQRFIGSFMYASRAHSLALGESEGTRCNKFFLHHCPLPTQCSKLK